MNIFTRKKSLLDRIADLESQIKVQSNEMDKLRKANTDINRQWRDAVKENKSLKDETMATKDEMRHQDLEHKRTIEIYQGSISNLEKIIAEKDHTIAELQDANSGLASSVSDLKKKLTAAQKAAKASKPAPKPKKPTKPDEK